MIPKITNIYAISDNRYSSDTNQKKQKKKQENPTFKEVLNKVINSKSQTSSCQ